jgi:hypothetical protein
VAKITSFIPGTFFKLGHFSATENYCTIIKWSSLQRRLSKFNPKELREIGSQIKAVENL